MLHNLNFCQFFINTKFCFDQFFHQQGIKFYQCVLPYLDKALLYMILTKCKWSHSNRHIFSTSFPWPVLIHIQCCGNFGLSAVLLRRIAKQISTMGDKNVNNWQHDNSPWKKDTPKKYFTFSIYFYF